MARVRGWGAAASAASTSITSWSASSWPSSPGTLIIGFEPVENIYELLLCAVFGSGAALILDEFALVFRLQDVYWSDEGRSSIDAVIIAITVGVLVLLHVVPFDDKTTRTSPL